MIRIMGTLTDPSGTPVSGAIIELRALGNSDTALLGAVLSAQCDEQGRYDFHLGDGRYDVYAQVDDQSDLHYLGTGAVDAASQDGPLSHILVDGGLAIEPPFLDRALAALQQAQTMSATLQQAQSSMSQDAAQAQQAVQRVTALAGQVDQAVQTSALQVTESTRQAGIATAQAAVATEHATRASDQAQRATTQATLAAQTQQATQAAGQRVATQLQTVIEHASAVAGDAATVADIRQTLQRSVAAIEQDAQQLANDIQQVKDDTASVLTAQTQVAQQAHAVATQTQTVTELALQVADHALAAQAAQVQATHQADTVLASLAAVNEQAQQIAAQVTASAQSEASAHRDAESVAVASQTLQATVPTVTQAAETATQARDAILTLRTAITQQSDTVKAAADTASQKAADAASASARASAAAERAEQAVQSLTGVLIDAGAYDARSGRLPAPVQVGGQPRSSLWKVTGAGTVGNIALGVGDSLIYTTSDRSYYKIDNTESVSSVNNKQGRVTLTADDIGAEAADTAHNEVAQHAAQPGAHPLAGVTGLAEALAAKQAASPLLTQLASGHTPLSFRNRVINSQFRFNSNQYHNSDNTGKAWGVRDGWYVGIGDYAPMPFVDVGGVCMVSIPPNNSLNQVIEGADLPAGPYVVSWLGTATCSLDAGNTWGRAGQVKFVSTGHDQRLMFGEGTLGQVQCEPGDMVTAYESLPDALESLRASRRVRRVYYPGPLRGVALGDGVVATFIWDIPMRADAEIGTASLGPMQGGDISVVACGQAGFNVVIANTHAHGRPVEWRIDTLDLYITAELVIL